MRIRQLEADQTMNSNDMSDGWTGEGLTIGQEDMQCFLNLELIVQDNDSKADGEDIVARVPMQEIPLNEYWDVSHRLDRPLAPRG